MSENSKNIVLHPKQSDVFSCTNYYRVLVAGRKFGKSTLALTELLRSAQGHKNNVYIAPTYKMARQTLWNDHIEKFLPKQLLMESNKTDMRIVLANGHTIQLFGSDDPDKLRGQNIDFAVMDEFQDFKASSWEAVIEPNLLATKGRALFMGTPKGKKNILFKQFAMRGNIYKSFHFTSYDNPLIDKELLETRKKRLIAEGKEDIWKQEYMAEFNVLAGLIYDNWRREVHVRDDVVVGKNGAFGLSVDRGMENPSAVGFYYIYRVDGDDRIHRYDEIYKSGLSPKALVEAIKNKMGNNHFSYMFCDPSAKDFMATAQENGLYIKPARRETGGGNTSWVAEGISKCKGFLAQSAVDGKPRFSVHPRCKDFIEEIEGYIWEEQLSDNHNLRETPRKLNDHCFVGDTRVLTKHGLTRIKDISAGDYVWSPLGWNKVYRSKCTGIKKVAQYGPLRATPDHKILTNNGLKEVDTLRNVDMIMVWGEQRPYTFKEYLTGVIRTPRGELTRFILGALLTKAKEARQAFYTEMFGNTIKARFRTVIWCIILTGILATMTLATLIWSVTANTLSFTIGGIGRAWRNTLTRLGSRRPSGMAAKKVKSGILNTLRRHGRTENKTRWRRFVRFVARSTKHPVLKPANTVIPTVNKRRFEEEEVYNLDTKLGCYFANGVLVSNCIDEWRYFICSYKTKKDYSKIMAEIPKSKYQKGFY